MAMPADSPAPRTTDMLPERRPNRAKVYVIGLILLVAIGGAIWYAVTPHATDAAAGAAKGKSAAGTNGGGFGAGGGGGAGGRGGGDPRTVMPVAVAPARSVDFVVYQNALGNVNAASTVTVRPRVDGQLVRVLFREGDIVKAGAVLAEIDPRPFEVQVMQANGQMARDQAQLANARIDLERYQTLLAQDSIAQQQVATQQALVRQLEGTVEADRGVVENAKLQLSYTKILAPSAGRVGLRQVDAGNMVRQSDANGIVVITQIQPIAVVFSIPEDRLQAVMRRMHGGSVLTVEAWDRAGKTKIATGKLASVDNQIDPTTGTIKLKAEFANENAEMFPNQFVNVRMEVDTLHNATVVPSSAVQRGNNGTFVYRVNDDDTVSMRPVQLGPAQGETTVIELGLAPGERVVTDGADKLRDGAKIEAVVPGAEASAPGAKSAAGQGGGQGRRNRVASDGGAPSQRTFGNGSRAGGNPDAGVPGPGSAIPPAPGAAAPAGNSPSTNAPGAGSPAAPPGVRASPSG
jgi:multidrug efflux system membrane fusion protein